MTRRTIGGVYVCAVLGILGLGAWAGHAQEKVVLTTPVLAATGAAEFRIWALDLRREHPDRPAGILATFREVNATGFLLGGRSIECRYEAAEAEALIVALNKTNLATISLEKRVITQCQTSGKLGAGAVTGTP
jgi:hypothetical protein